MDTEVLRKVLETEHLPFMEEIIRDVINIFLIPKFMSLGMDATGEWRESLEAKNNILRGRKYTEQLEYGRRPGKFAPIEPLIRWVEAKFGISGAEGVRIAWAVNHKIKEEGTSWYQAGGSDLMEILNSDEVVRYINDRLRFFYVDKVSLHFSQAILTALKNNS